MSDIGIQIPWPILIIFAGVIYWQVPLILLIVMGIATMLTHGVVRIVLAILTTLLMVEMGFAIYAALAFQH